MSKEKILSLNIERQNLLSKENLLKSEELQIDKYANDILNIIKEDFHNLSFDFIFEQLSYLGHAPNLLYDDNGHWVVTSDGFQSINSEDSPQDVELFFFIEAKYWKDSPMEALKSYIFED